MDPDAQPVQHDQIQLDCPRCGAALGEEFYGPCPDCRRELRAAMGGRAGAVVVADYEPKMNVTPNMVATKE